MEFTECLDEFQKLVNRITDPRVVVDNDACDTATVVKVDCSRNREILLAEVQVFTDLNLSIKKAYISTDGRWFLDVFHVTDQHGNKIMNKELIHNMEQSLAMIHLAKWSALTGLISVEITGADHIGLLSEVFAVLDYLKCDVVKGKVWTHNGRITSLIHIKDCDPAAPAEEGPSKLGMIEAQLVGILKCCIRCSKTSVPQRVTHAERRLHQMMFLDQDYLRKPPAAAAAEAADHLLPCVTVEDMAWRGFSIVNIQCRDRIKLLFDVLCNFTDMQYDVFHASIRTAADQAYLDFLIRGANGFPITSEAEKQRVVLCLEAAIERRAPKGLRLELKAGDRRGLLADMTSVLRECSLSVARADISTAYDDAYDVFYVTNEEGGPPYPNAIEAVLKSFGERELQVKEEAPLRYCCEEGGGRGDDRQRVAEAIIETFLLFGSLVKRNLCKLGLLFVHNSNFDSFFL